MSSNYQYYLAKALNNWQPLLPNAIPEISISKPDWFKLLSSFPPNSKIAIPLFHGLLSSQMDSQKILGKGWLRQLSMQNKYSLIILEQIIKKQKTIENQLSQLSNILDISIEELEQSLLAWLHHCWQVNQSLLTSVNSHKLDLYLYIIPEQLSKKLAEQLLQFYPQCSNIKILDGLANNTNQSIHFMLPEQLAIQKVNKNYQERQEQLDFQVEQFAAAEQRQLTKSTITPITNLPHSSPLWQIGFNKLGSCFTLFTLELVKSLQQQPVDEVWFLARDGYLLKELYQLFSLKAEKMGYMLPQAKYIYASRTSTLAAAYPEPTPELLSKLFHANKNQGLMGIATSLGFDSNYFSVSHFWPQYQSAPVTQQIINQVFSEPLVLEIYRENQKIAAKNLLAYLKQNINKESRSVSMVDIGWNGTVPLQLQSLQKQLGLLHIDIKLFGRNYHNYNEINNSRTKNFIFHAGLIYDQKRNNPIENCVNQFRELFELAACSDENTVIAYQKSQKIYKPKFVSGENQQRVKNSQQLQSGIIAQAGLEFNDWLKNGWTLEALRPNALIKAAELVMQPTNSEQKALSELEFETGRGSIDTEVLAKNKVIVKQPPFSPIHFHLTDNASLQGIVNQLTSLIAKVQQLGSIVIYGAGSACNLLLPHLNQVEFIVDNNKNLQGSCIYGIKVKPIEDIQYTKSIILVTVLNRQVEIQSLLASYSNQTYFLDDL